MGKTQTSMLSSHRTFSSMFNAKFRTSVVQFQDEETFTRAIVNVTEGEEQEKVCMLDFRRVQITN